MEEYTGIFDVRSVNPSFYVSNFLRKYNNSISNRYDDFNGIRDHQVFQYEDFKNLQDEKTFTETERKVIDRFQSSKGLERGDEFLTSIEKYFFETLEQENLSPSHLDSSSPRAKLRRTLAIIYKSALIPYLDVNKGGFKEVIGPIGIDVVKKREITQKVIDSIGPIWQWDGNISPSILKDDEKEEREVKSEQVVLVRGNNAEHEGKSNIEFDKLSELVRILDDPNYLPKVHHKTQNARLVEYIPNEFSSDFLPGKISDVLLVAKALQDMWVRGGVVMTDIKRKNIKKRVNGEPVIIDIGSLTSEHPEDQTFSVVNKEFTVDCIPPEFANYFTDRSKQIISSEPFIVYQIGVLLFQSIYSSREYQEALKEHHGLVWEIPSDGSSTSLVKNCAISSDTLDYLSSRYPNKEITSEISRILNQSLEKDPAKRPHLDLLIEELQKAMDSETNL